MIQTPELLIDDLFFPEGPRWRTGANDTGTNGTGALWFSDLLAGSVKRVDLDGTLETLVEVPELPSGLGWWPDGRLVIVSLDGKLNTLEQDGSLQQVADMHALDGFGCNDMIVDAKGYSYIGSYQEFDESRHPGPGNMPGFSHIHLVKPDGSVRIVADRMTFPNGSVITPDGKTFIVAESFANRITAFDIEADGSLHNRRVWADLGAPPDGITMDQEGCLWVAVPYYIYGGPGGYVRVREGGEIVERIDIDDFASYACTLGGPEMRTLFLCQSTLIDRECHQGDGRIMIVEVDVPGTGTP